MVLKRILAGVSGASQQSFVQDQHAQTSSEPCFGSFMTAWIAFTSPRFEKRQSETAESSNRHGTSEDKGDVSQVRATMSCLPQQEVLVDGQGEELCDYERERLDRMAVNKQVLVNLHIEKSLQNPQTLLAKPKIVRQRIGHPSR